MAAVGKYLRSLEGGLISFFCPACKCGHPIRIGPGGWEFNGNEEKPTFKPSVSLKTGHYASHHTPGDPCWCTYDAEAREKGEPVSGFACGICHSFVTDGRIEFLPDCTHALAGQTVDLPEYIV